MSKTPQRARDTYHVGNLAPQLLQAAREMLEEVGPTKLSLRAVSERVGVSSTAAYHHYANRAELVGQHGRREPTTRTCQECLSEGHSPSAGFCRDCGARLPPYQHDADVAG